MVQYTDSSGPVLSVPYCYPSSYAIALAPVGLRKFGPDTLRLELCQETRNRACPAGKRAIILRADEEGRPDLNALEESVTPTNMTDWMRHRLQGRDTLWGIDLQGMESPERVFIEVWRRAAPQSNVRHALKGGCEELLKIAWTSAPVEWHGDLLDLVRTIRPEQCKIILRQPVEGGAFSEELVRLDLDRQWLQAAAAYRWDTKSMLDGWRRLLPDPRYTVIAFRALAHDVETGIWAMPGLWKALEDQEEKVRRFVLRQAVRMILEHAGSDWVAQFGRNKSRLSEHPGLCEAIDAALAELGRPTIVERVCAKVASPPAPAKHSGAGNGRPEKLRGIAGNPARLPKVAA